MSHLPRFGLSVVAVLLVVAGPAAAAPQRDALFGGGALGAGNKGSLDADAHFLGAHIDKDDPSKLKFFADVGLKCGKHGAGLASITSGVVQIGADGTFSGQANYAASGPFGKEGGPVQFTGRFVSDTRITGTVNATSTVRLKGKAPYTCRSGAVQYTMVDNDHDANAAPFTPGATYVGTTAQGYSALLRLGADGSVAKAANQGNLTCKAVKNGPFNFVVMPGALIKLAADGSFQGAERHTSKTSYVKPAFSRITWVLKGSFAGGKLAGNWRGTMKVYSLKNHKKQIDTCTATIPFQAVPA